MTEQRRFKATEQTTIRDLQATMRQMGATSLKIGQDFTSGEYEIVFDRAGRRYVFRCNKWKNSLDNLRAAQRTISLLYQAMEEYGTTQTVSRGSASGSGQKVDPFLQFFLPFEATPDDTVLLLGSGAAPWWEVLGVSQSASRTEIVNAFRALAKVHHPDTGGTADDFKRLRSAYEQALAGLGG
ncbi:MAG: DnaJ domain-containing protein [Dehalococcoidia bacterium]